VAKLRVRINKRRPSHFANVGSLYIRFRRRLTKPSQRRAAASNAKLVDFGLAAIASITPIASSGRVPLRNRASELDPRLHDARVQFDRIAQ
jgi:hypothetical protein